MIRTINLLLIALFISQILSAQTKKVENNKVEIDYIDTEEVSNTFNLNSSTRIKSNDFQKIKIKCKLNTDERYILDINKFSLVDRANKIRYRPTDISYQPVVGYMAYEKILMEDIEVNEYFKGLMGVSYDPNYKDKFYDFSLENYFNFELPVNFGTAKKPILRKIYFRNHKFKKFKALLFFPLLTNTDKNPNLELVYGDKLISEIQL